MACNKKTCGCNFNVKTVGKCNASKLNIDGSKVDNLNWTEISVPEILCIPKLKPDIEEIDQVYAKIILDNVKLIETPFAYKQYILYTFYISVNGLSTSLPGLITTLTEDVAAILNTPLETTLIAAFNTLETTLGALTATPGVPELIKIVNKLETTIFDLINNINVAVTAVSTAADNLIAALKRIPFSAQAICEAIKSLTDTLDELTTLINSIVGVLTGILNSLNNAVASIKDTAVITAVNALVGVLTTLINTTIPPLVTTTIKSINSILSALTQVDCDNAYAFTLIGNAEGTCLSGRKLIIEGTLKQKIVYTAEVDTQSVHSAHYEVPFMAFIIPYAKFEGLTYQKNIEVYDPVTNGPIFINGYVYDPSVGITVDLCEEFNIEKCIEDVYVYALDPRRIFKNVTVFLKAKPGASCN